MKMTSIRGLITFFFAMFLVGCGSRSDELAMRFRQECLGDHTIRCRTMMIDLAAAKLEAQVDAFNDNKDKIVGCVGEEKFAEGMKLGKEKISYFYSLRPSIFARWFMSSAEVEFDPPPFQYERESFEFQKLLKACPNAR